MKTVLLAEDSEDDIFVMKLACERTGIPHRLQVVTDGTMAIDYLSGNGGFANRMVHSLPSVIFLDIKMPKGDGFHVLEWVRAQPHLTELPIVMLTNSLMMEDIHRAYKLGATSYLQKNTNQAEFTEAVRIIMQYWLELNISRSSHE